MGKVTAYAHMKKRRSALPGLRFVRVCEQERRPVYVPHLDRISLCRDGGRPGGLPVKLCRCGLGEGTWQGANVGVETVFTLQNQGPWPEIEGAACGLDSSPHGTEFSIL